MEATEWRRGPTDCTKGAAIGSLALRTCYFPLSCTSLLRCFFYYLLFSAKFAFLFFFQPPDQTEILEGFFSLYNAKLKHFITEDYQIFFNGSGVPLDEDKLYKMKTIFKVRTWLKVAICC